MQLVELRDVLVGLLDEDGVRRADATLDDSLNDGYQLAAVLSQACEKVQTFTFDAEQHFQTLPSEYFLATAVYWGTSRLWPIRMGDLDQLTSDWIDAATGTPLYYFVQASLSREPQLWLYPRPTAAARVKLVHSIVPQRLGEDGDTPMFPAEHHYCLTQWAYAWELLKERGSLFANKAFRVFQDFVAQVNDLQNYVYRRTPDRDWQMRPWDSEAVRRKLLSFETPLSQTPSTSERQDLSV